MFLLLNNLDESIAKSVLFCKTAREIWVDLEERFGYPSMGQVYLLEQQQFDLIQGTKFVSDYFTKLKAIWDAQNDVDPNPHCTCNLCVCHINQRFQKKQQDRRLIQFMMTLHDKFASIRANILMRYPLPPLSNAFILFAQE